jgi:hypothetical protein
MRETYTHCWPLAVIGWFLTLPLHAGELQLILDVNPSMGTWAATAQITDTSISFEQDQAEPGDAIVGIGSFAIDVLAGGNLSIDSAQRTPPQGLESSLSLQTGFFLFGSNGNLAGDHVTDIRASQDTVSNNDPTGRRVLESVGLAAGNDGSAPLAAAWSFPAVLATGTFSGTAGTLTLQPHAGFDGDSDPDPQSFTLLYGGDPGTGINAWDDSSEVEFAQLVQSSTVTIGVPGDYDHNGLVEPADYDVWTTTYGSTTILDADGNGSGKVDAADYTVWRDSLPAPGQASSVAVPEPATICLAALILATTGCVRRRL